jgi:hypothetical protein
MGLCSTGGDFLVAGACHWTSHAWVFATEAAIQAQAGGGFSIINGLKAVADYGSGIANFAVSTATLGNVHISAPYCQFGWAADVGYWYGAGAAALLTLGDTAGGSALADASEAANSAADNIDDFTLSAKHFANAGGRYSTFASEVDPYSAIEDALRSPDAQFYPNPQIPGTFKLVADLGQTIGSAGQTAVRVIVTDAGKIVTAFPVKG